MVDQCSPPPARTAAPTRDAGTFPEGPRQCSSIPTPASLALLGSDGVWCVVYWVRAVLDTPFLAFLALMLQDSSPGEHLLGTCLFWDLVFTISGIFQRTCRVTTLTVSILRRGKRGLSHTAILGTAKSSQTERKGEEVQSETGRSDHLSANKAGWGLGGSWSKLNLSDCPSGWCDVSPAPPAILCPNCWDPRLMPTPSIALAEGTCPPKLAPSLWIKRRAMGLHPHPLSHPLPPAFLPQ